MADAVDADMKTVLRNEFRKYGLDLSDPDRGQMGLEFAICQAMRRAYDMGVRDGKLLGSIDDCCWVDDPCPKHGGPSGHNPLATGRKMPANEKCHENVPGSHSWNDRQYSVSCAYCGIEFDKKNWREISPRKTA